MRYTLCLTRAYEKATKLPKVCISKLSEPAKDKTLKGAEIEKFLCKLFNVAEYIFTQYIVTLFFFLSFLKYYPALFVLPA